MKVVFHEDFYSVYTSDPAASYTMGSLVRKTADKNNGGCFAILEGGYNHDVLGRNTAALMEGLST